ncbi:hypothetical protein QNM99_20340 [Pseudomonas sp. PCH446]
MSWGTGYDPDDEHFLDAAADVELALVDHAQIPRTHEAALALGSGEVERGLRGRFLAPVPG